MTRWRRLTRRSHICLPPPKRLITTDRYLRSSFQTGRSGFPIIGCHVGSRQQTHQPERCLSTNKTKMSDWLKEERVCPPALTLSSLCSDCVSCSSEYFNYDHVQRFVYNYCICLIFFYFQTFSGVISKVFFKYTYCTTRASDDDGNKMILMF